MMSQKTKKKLVNYKEMLYNQAFLVLPPFHSLHGDYVIENDDDKC